MSTCARCGSGLPPDAQFCRACGAPAGGDAPHGPRPDWRPPDQVLPAPTAYGAGAPPPRAPRAARRGGPRPALVAGAVLAVLTVAGAATGVILRSSHGTAAAPAVPTFAPAPPSVRLPLPLSVSAVPSAAPSTAPSTAADPEDELRLQLEGDADTVESLVGKWVPQLSSKREGDVIAGTRYDPAAVLADFRGWQAKVPGSVLTRSERFTSFRAKNYWVTLAAQPFDSAQAANKWCDDEGLAPDDCFAKRLSHTEGPSGNTRPR